MVNKKKLLDITRKVDFVISKLDTKTISDTDLLICVGLIVIRRLGIPETKKQKEQL